MGEFCSAAARAQDGQEEMWRAFSALGLVELPPAKE